jgi:hypothetical protein
VRVKGSCEDSRVSRPRLLLAAAALACTAGCGEDPPAPRASATPTASAAPAPRGPALRHAHCPPNTGNCAAVTGRVIYVEAVDPDGDGDAHYVLAGGHVTAPGLTAVDIERELRPRRLARLGELVSAAGPVYEGSHGQMQIQATELHQQHR